MSAAGNKEALHESTAGFQTGPANVTDHSLNKTICKYTFCSHIHAEKKSRFSKESHYRCVTNVWNH